MRLQYVICRFYIELSNADIDNAGPVRQLTETATWDKTAVLFISACKATLVRQHCNLHFPYGSFFILYFQIFPFSTRKVNTWCTGEHIKDENHFLHEYLHTWIQKWANAWLDWDSLAILTHVIYVGQLQDRRMIHENYAKAWQCAITSHQVKISLRPILHQLKESRNRSWQGVRYVTKILCHIEGKKLWENRLKITFCPLDFHHLALELLWSCSGVLLNSYSLRYNQPKAISLGQRWNLSLSLIKIKRHPPRLK